MKYLTPITLSLALLSTSAIAKSNTFQMAVVEGTLGAKEITSGDYAEAVDLINNEAFIEDQYLMIAAKMNLCVAYTHLNQWQLANSACNSAVSDSQSLAKSDRTYSNKQMVTIALNNRAMSQVQQDNYDSALEDLRMANRVSKNRMTKRNLLALKQHKKAQLNQET